ncbi:hypothetical protein JCM5350_008357, partial [Sporobolomyces pararoseus]
MDPDTQLQGILAVRNRLNNYNENPMTFTPPDEATSVARTERLALLFQLLLEISLHKHDTRRRAFLLLRAFVSYVLLCAAE